MKQSSRQASAGVSMPLAVATSADGAVGGVVSGAALVVALATLEYALKLVAASVALAR